MSMQEDDGFRYDLNALHPGTWEGVLRVVRYSIHLLRISWKADEVIRINF